MAIQYIDNCNIDFNNKKVFCRFDFNVPLGNEQQILDEQRILSALPTINYLLERNAKLIIASHLGRPNGKIRAKLSLEPVAARLQQLLDREIIFSHECIGDGVSKLARQLPEGGILFLENLRFNSAEEKNSTNFCKNLANLADIYVNDAFGVCHRHNASVNGAIQFFDKTAAGLLIKREIEALNRLRFSPKKPFMAILGGAKVSDKLGVIGHLLLNSVDKIVVGGAMAYTFLAAKGIDVGSSKVEPERLQIARHILQNCSDKKIDIILPVDHVVTKSFSPDAQKRLVDTGHFEEDDIAMDIGPKTIEMVAKYMPEEGTIFCNGTMGVFEWERFSNGTYQVMKKLASLHNEELYSVVGGGHAVAAIVKSQLQDKVNHISTGGGASLEFIEGKILPGLQVLGYDGGNNEQ